MVTGGLGGRDYLNSTEILYPGATSWVPGGDYPFNAWWPVAASINNNIISVGGFSYDVYNDTTTVYTFHNEVYKFNKDNLSWEEVGQLDIGRNAHALAVVNKNDVEKYCSFDKMDVKYKQEFRNIGQDEIVLPPGYFV